MNMKLIKMYKCSTVWKDRSESKHKTNRPKREIMVDAVQAMIWEEIKWEILF